MEKIVGKIQVKHGTVAEILNGAHMIHTNGQSVKTILLCNALHASVDYVVSDDISTRDDEIMTDIRAQLVKLTPDEKQYFYHMIVGYIQLKGENAATKTLLAAKKEL